VIASPPATTAETKKPIEKPVERPRLDIWVIVPGALDRMNPVIRIEYKFVATEGSFKIILPAEREVAFFKDICLNVDGKSAGWANLSILDLDPAFSRREVLTPGKSATLDIPLAKIFKIPENWKMLEIIPVRMTRVRGFTGTLKITDDRKPAEEKEK
jgi:hypothetical protein